MTNGDIRDDMVTEWPSVLANQRLALRALTNERPGAICNGNISDDRGTMNGTIESEIRNYIT